MFDTYASVVYFRDGYGFTAAHAAELNQEIYLYFGEENVKAKVIGITSSKGHDPKDIALIKFSKIPFGAKELSSINELNYQENTKVIGFLKEIKTQLNLKILTEDYYRIILSEGVIEGFSGDLLIDSKDHVLGVVLRYSYKYLSRIVNEKVEVI